MPARESHTTRAGSSPRSIPTRVGVGGWAGPFEVRLKELRDEPCGLIRHADDAIVLIEVPPQEGLQRLAKRGHLIAEGDQALTMGPALRNRGDAIAVEALNRGRNQIGNLPIDQQADDLVLPDLGRPPRPPYPPLHP